MAQKVETQLTAKDKTKTAFRSVSRGLNTLRKSVFSLKGAFIGAIGIGGLGLFIKKTLETIDVNKKMADTLGLTTAELKGYEFGAILAGESVETLQKGLQKLEFNLGQAAQGIGQAKYGLEALNMDFRELNSLKPNERFLAVADAIKNLGTMQEKTTIAGELFGKSGMKLLLLFEQGSEAIKDFQHQAEVLGLSLSGEQSAAVEKFIDTFAVFKMILQGVAQTLMVALVPFMQAFLQISLDTLTLWAKDGGPDRLAKALADEIFKAVMFTIQLGAMLKVVIDALIVGIEKLKIFTGVLGTAKDLIQNMLLDGLIVGTGKTIWEKIFGKDKPKEITKAEKFLTDFELAFQKALETSNTLIADIFIAMEENQKKVEGALNSVVSTLTQSMGDLKDKALIGFGTAFGTTMEQVIMGTKKMSDAFKDLGKVILSSLVKMFVAQAFVNPLAKGLGFLAGGGHAQGGSPYIVGERGPELFVPSTSGEVIPNNKLGGIGGGITIEQNINFATGIQASVRSEVLQLLPAIAQVSKGAVQDAQLRR